MANFREHYNLPDATIDDIIKSNTGGVGRWATIGLNTNARSPIGQAFGRSLKWDSKWSSLYPWMDDRLKQEFRLNWCVQKDFQFAKECKRVVLKTEKSIEDAGEMLPMVTIARRLGGADNSECLAMARGYCATAEQVGGAFVADSSWLGCRTYLFIQRLTRSRCVKEWSLVTESSATINVWEERARECMAKTKFAWYHGRDPKSVELSEVSASEQGIAGWADASITAPATAIGKASPLALATAISKASAPGKSHKRGGTGETPSPAPKVPKKYPASTSKKAEADCKETVSRYNSLVLKVKEYREAADASPTEWTWGQTWLAQSRAFVDQLEEKISTFEDDFAAKFMAAALSPAMLRDLKKRVGSRYDTMLILLRESLQPLLDQLGDLMAKIESHREVGKPKMPKAQAKKKVKKAAAAALE